MTMMYKIMVNTKRKSENRQITHFKACFFFFFWSSHIHMEDNTFPFSTKHWNSLTTYLKLILPFSVWFEKSSNAQSKYEGSHGHIIEAPSCGLLWQCSLNNGKLYLNSVVLSLLKRAHVWLAAPRWRCMWRDNSIPWTINCKVSNLIPSPSHVFTS